MRVGEKDRVRLERNRCAFTLPKNPGKEQRCLSDPPRNGCCRPAVTSTRKADTPRGLSMGRVRRVRFLLSPPIAGELCAALGDRRNRPHNLRLLWEGNMMRYLIAATAIALLATPALADTTPNCAGA